VTLANALPALLALTLILCVLRIFHRFRARAMRTLATTWGFQYIGPPAPKWWNPFRPRISLPIPTLVFHGLPTLRQVWNVIEGEQNGKSVLIFDAVIGAKGGAPCTFIACQAGQNPFGVVISPDRLVQSHGWAVVHGVWFLWFSWEMGIKRLERYVKKLRTGSTRFDKS
jgi:hypothetical protein